MATISSLKQIFSILLFPPLNLSSYTSLFVSSSHPSSSVEVFSYLDMSSSDPLPHIDNTLVSNTHTVYTNLAHITVPLEIVAHGYEPLWIRIFIIYCGYH